MSTWRKRIRFSRWAAAGALLLAAASVGRSVASGSPTVPRPEDVAAGARTLSGEGDEKLFVPPGAYVGGQGVVEPADREIEVAAAVAGRIAKVEVREGQRVARGDVIVELDSAVEAAMVEIAKAEVARDEAELTKARNGQRAEDRRAVEAEAQAARARADQSKGIEERLRKAAQGGGATGDDVDRAAKQAAQDLATANAAEARRNAAFAGSRYEDLAAAQARLQASKARLSEAEARLEQRLVRAPIDGEVLSVKVRAGEQYQPGSDGLVILGDTSKLRVRIDVDERDVAAVQTGADVIVRVASHPGVDFTGKVAEIGRRMGRKNVRADDPVERNDTKILEVVCDLEKSGGLYVGQRVVGFVARAGD
ncbi:MAG: efflux RND transporter periplasmic adaptor subunit [Myxococcales bacterium]|nr:efflux RND transporter periplasmic adaptor subunit [Myxococcales bacterium]